MRAKSKRAHSVAGLRRTGLVLLLLIAGLLAPGPVQAADVVTEGDMEDTGTINWPHTDLTETNSSDENATDQVNSPTHSLKSTSASGQERLNVGWYNAQTVGTIGPADTVTLSLWWGAQFNVSSQSAQGDLFVDAKPTSGVWGADDTTLWTLQLVASTTFQSGTVTNLDVSEAVSGAFPTTESYDLRVRFEGRTGRDVTATVNIWWDDIVLDVTTPGGDDTLTVSQTNVPSADVPQGTTEKLLQVLDLSIDNVGNGTTSVQEITVTRLGTAVDADTTAGGVELWHDANDNSSWDGGVDTQLSTSKTFSGGTVTFDAIGFAVNNGTPEKLLITVDVAAAGASTEGNTIGAQTTGMVLSDSDVITGLPQSGNTHAISDSGDQLTAGQTATGGGNVDQGTVNHVVQVLDLTVDNDSAQLTDLDVTRTGTAQDADTDAGGVKLWHDVNDNNVYDDGTDTQLDGAQTFSAGTVTFSGIGFTVTAGTPEKVLVTYDIASGAQAGRTIGAQVNTNGGITVASPDTVANSGLLTGDSFTIQAAGNNDTLTVTQTNVPSADVPQGTTEKLLQVLDLSIDNVGNGTTSVQQLSVTRLGSAVDADTVAGGVELWHDVNNNSSWDIGTDVQLDGSQTFSGGTVTFTAIGFAVNNGTPEKLLITVDVAGPGASTEGNTIGAQTTAIVLSDSDTVSGLPLSSNTHTITDSGDQLTAAQTLTGGGSVNQGAANVVAQVLDLTVDNDTAQLTNLTVTRTGTAQDGDTVASGIKLWHDVNDNNAYDNGTDTQLDGSQTFSAGTVAFSGIGFTVTAGTPEKVLVTYDIAAGAVPGRTIGAQVNTNGGITVASPDTVANSGLLPSDLFTIQAATGDNLSASNNTPIRGLDPEVGETGLVMQRLQLDSDTAGDGVIELTSVSVGDEGTAQTADIATVSVYMGASVDFASAVLVGSETFNVDPKTVLLTGGTVADRTITNPSPKYIWVVYDLAGGAVAGRTIQSRIIDLIVAAPDTELLGQAFDSNLLTLLTVPQNDTDVTGSEAFVTQCSLSSSDTGQITVMSRFTGDANDDGAVEVRYETSPTVPDGTSPLACATVTGPSPRQCLVTSLAPATYNIRVNFSDPDTVGGATNPQTINGLTVATCGADTSAATVLILSPWRDAIIGGTEKVRVQVYDQGGGLVAGDLLWAVDTGTLASTGVSINGTYDCGTDCSIFEFDLDTTTVNGGLTDDSHRLVVQVTDGGGQVTRVEQAFRVRNLGGNPGGSGQLLRRSAGSRLCLDCHDLPTHSSQSTSTRYGTWAMACNDCHTPHGTTNIFLLREEIRTPNSGTLEVRFEKAQDDPGAGAVQDSTALGDASYANEDADTNPGTAPAHGPCQACHTKTQSGGTERWRNTLAGGNNDNHYDFGRPTQACTNCHGHGVGFSGAGGGSCSGCHFGSGSQAVQAGRRDVEIDFGKRSHHVGTPGGTMNGVLTDFDCVVCHAEGRVNAQGETETIADFHNDNDCSGSHCIDLKDVDNWNDAAADPTANPVFRYDKQRLIDKLSGGTPGTTPGAWGSGDADWEDETSERLDPFCLTCHDFDGATASRNEDNTVDTCGTPTDGLNPFCDGTITNEYDQYDRTRVTDIASRAAEAWRIGPAAPTGYSATLRDQAGEPRYDETPTGDTISDPPLGIYSRHAIRGVAMSTVVPGDSGFSGAASVYANATDANGDIPTSRWVQTNFTWEDNSVMGCADCHTVDGANHTDGNAHGSNSEYLLKDADGLATIGTFAGKTYNCYRCHSPTYYDYGATTETRHTDNSSDWVDTAGNDAPNRSASDGNIFGIACMNCHGGVESGIQSAPVGPEFGTIHGTTQTYGIGENGDSGTRLAYRFMNGNSLRYYDPNSWTNTTISCYTIDSNEEDSFGACSQHSKSPKTFTKLVQRDLKY